MAARRVPDPESANELTVRVTCEGTVRSSSASSRGRKRGAAGRCVARLRGARFDVRFRSQEENHMMFLLSGTGLRYNEKANAAGAQTERRGKAWAGECIAWWRELTGRCCCLTTLLRVLISLR